jgi:hypothetical protein
MDTQLKEAIDRFIWNIKNLFDFNTNNPYVLDGEGDFTPKRRTAIEDFFHSLKNLPVEYLRMKGVKKPKETVEAIIYTTLIGISIALIYSSWSE